MWGQAAVEDFYLVLEAYLRSPWQNGAPQNKVEPKRRGKQRYQHMEGYMEGRSIRVLQNRIGHNFVEYIQLLF